MTSRQEIQTLKDQIEKTKQESKKIPYQELERLQGEYNQAILKMNREKNNTPEIVGLIHEAIVSLNALQAEILAIGNEDVEFGVEEAPPPLSPAEQVAQHHEFLIARRGAAFWVELTKFKTEITHLEQTGTVNAEQVNLLNSLHNDIKLAARKYFLQDDNPSRATFVAEVTAAVDRAKNNPAIEIGMAKGVVNSFINKINGFLEYIGVKKIELYEPPAANKVAERPQKIAADFLNKYRELREDAKAAGSQPAAEEQNKPS